MFLEGTMDSIIIIIIIIIIIKCGQRTLVVMFTKAVLLLLLSLQYEKRGLRQVCLRLRIAALYLVELGCGFCFPDVNPVSSVNWNKGTCLYWVLSNSTFA